MSNNVLKLFECCLITKGHRRSLITDTQRDQYFFIPNSLACLFDENNVLHTHKGLSSAEEREIMGSYIDFLIQNELCFYCNEDLVAQFPPLKTTEWDYPARISNAIVEVNADNLVPYFSLLQELADQYLTRNFELYFPVPLDLETLCSIADNVDLLDCYCCTLIFELTDNARLEDTIAMLQSHAKVFRSIIGSTGKAAIIDAHKFGWGNIVLLENRFSYKNCGVTDVRHFCNNLEHITESLQHNTCLNRKVAIDLDGNVKNCPNMPLVQGNIHQSPLSAIMAKPAFTRYWNIKKEDINGCRDCEFRHICTDCRAFTEQPEDLYSKPLKCGYDPYNCIWEDWSINPIKQKAITHYELSATL